MNKAARTDKYRKSPSREQLLRRINAMLEPLDATTAEAVEPRLPVVFIIGAPRSATTLVSQIFAHAECFGYPSNFVARFFAAPSLGILMQRALGIVDDGQGSYFSEYGVTRDWNEPHEFGYFWDRWFDLGQEANKLDAAQLETVDHQGLRASVARMEAAAGRPMVFKNNTWCTLQAGYLRRVFPKSVWVVCQRHPLYAAQSIALGRQRRYGNFEAWWSIRPTQYRQLLALPWWEQVVWQVHHILDDMERELGLVPSEQVVRVRYENLCADPGAPLRSVERILRRMGVTVKPSEPRTALQCQDIRQLEPGAWERVRSSCRQAFGQEYQGWVF
jgi:hypothetical protein